MRRFYQFRQNNSGGYWAKDLGRYVFIEAESEQAALACAEDRGLYFDGVAEGRDCVCCGDRWDPPHWDTFTLEQVAAEVEANEDVMVVYADGNWSHKRAVGDA